MKLFSKTLFIFRRDLRLNDNTGLHMACEQSKQVIPCFIVDPDQVSRKNAYRSMNAIQFMTESLEDLQRQLSKQGGTLYLFYGNAARVVQTLIKKEHIDAIFCNKDYTPFSIHRDKLISQQCQKSDVAFVQTDDALLNEPHSILTTSGTAYTIFTPYWKAASKHPVLKPRPCHATNFFTGTIPTSKTGALFKKIVTAKNIFLAEQGGRKRALTICKHLELFKNYQTIRDIPSQDTTHLSAHIKFGTISIREAYWAILHALGATAHQGLLRQLYWHDFYYQVAYHNPHVFGSAFHKKYDHIKWHYSKHAFKRWCDGTTGFPIVDAGMRQLNKTGYMHNRVRMIVASFLTKDLLIDWRWGEQYFAQHLVDYDPCVNNGNWQWSASTGCDAQPYFRIFNPWLQQKKFDSGCTYIKEWVEELVDVDVAVIHTWYKDTHPKLDYPRPMVDHARQKEKAIAMFKK